MIFSLSKDDVLPDTVDVDDTIRMYDVSKRSLSDAGIRQMHKDVDMDNVFRSFTSCASYVGGSKVMQRIVSSRLLSGISDLASRQSVLKNINLDDYSVVPGEEDVLWLLKMYKTPSLRTVIDMYTSFTTWPLNLLNYRSGRLLSFLYTYQTLISPIVSLLTPLSYMMVPYIGISIHLKRMISLREFFTVIMHTASTVNKTRWISLMISMFVYIQTTIQSVYVAFATRHITSKMLSKMQSAFSFLNRTGEIISKLNVTGMRSWFSNMDDVAQPVQWSCNKYSSIGSWIHQMWTTDPKHIMKHMNLVYAIDALVGIVKYKDGNGFHWASYESLDSPKLSITGMKHPALDNSVENDVELYGDHRNMMLSGPNAGGKSTLMRAVLCNVILAQTATISCSTGPMSLTPFRSVCSNVDISDDVGRESLFEAEMNRAINIVDTLSKSKHHTLVIVDELFSSTNPIEGMSAAVACTSFITRKPGCLSIISTHYTPICKILEKTGKDIVNYNLPTVSSDPIKYSYKLAQGISNQYIAIELIKQKTKSKLADTAIRIKNKLLMGSCVSKPQLDCSKPQQSEQTNKKD